MTAIATDSPTVLAVDDSLVVHEIVRRTLEPECRVLTAQTAVDALALLYHESIHAVLLDVMMPEVDGLDFCRTLRSLPNLQDLPIIMLTSKDSTFDRVQGHMAGATKYLTKPFQPDQLRQTLWLLLVDQFPHLQSLLASLSQSERSC